MIVEEVRGDEETVMVVVKGVRREDTVGGLSREATEGGERREGTGVGMAFEGTVEGGGSEDDLNQSMNQCELFFPENVLVIFSRHINLVPCDNGRGASIGSDRPRTLNVTKITVEKGIGRFSHFARIG